MGTREQGARETYEMHPIGYVRRVDNGIRLEIDGPFRPALKQMDLFSHVLVFWWADRFDSEEGRSLLQVNPPYAEEHLTGIFATRSPLRPNPVMMTTCTLQSVDEESGVLEVSEIDAYDGTGIVDLKAYFPVCDRVQAAHIPEWLSEWPEWMPEEGVGLTEGEE